MPTETVIRPPAKQHTKAACATARGRAASAQSIPAHLRDLLRENDYDHLTVISGVICGLHHFNFTTGLMVGLSETSYQRRYCYERHVDALAALQAWDGQNHPSGPWIKCKGMGIDLLNPLLRA